MSRRGFTLIELLVVMAIIAILTGMVLGAIALSQAAARESKTRTLITALNNLLMEEWDSYRTRRLPIAMLPAERSTAGGITLFADRQLTARRELMRMELPDRWTDVADDPVSLPTIPAKSLAFRRKYQAKASHPKIANEQDAECLYLIVESLRSDEATELLKRNSADTDGDGLLEIVDAWGKPIRWLRWPVGFLNLPGGDYLTDLNDTGAHDPFDPRKLQADAFLVMPLIYSAGPDGEYDILGDFVDTSGNPSLHYRDAFNGRANNPYRADTATGYAIGAPADFKSDGLNHLDNIHNHMQAIR